MRIWSLHPQYLDRQGLTAGWREALLAQAVLSGRTRGYTRHPQVERLRTTTDPVGCVGAVLTQLQLEASARGYSFDRARIERPDTEGLWSAAVPVSAGQVAHEWGHLLSKLADRSPEVAARWRDVAADQVLTHPVFRIVPGPVAEWERVGG